MPDEQDAQAFAQGGDGYAAQLVARACWMVQGVAVVPEHRGEGVAGRIKRFADVWAMQHGACLVLSIPTNEQAARMNEKAGHTVLPPQVALVLQIEHHGRTSTAVYPIDGTVPEARWAFRVVAQPHGFAMRVGQMQPADATRGRYHEPGAVHWITRRLGR